MRCAASEYICETLNVTDGASVDIPGGTVGIILVMDGSWTIEGHEDRVLVRSSDTVLVGIETYAMDGHAISITGGGRLAYVYTRSFQAEDRMIERDVVPTTKPWGVEYNVDAKSEVLMLKALEVLDGRRTSLHYHEKKVETMMFLGAADEPQEVMHVEAGVRHRIEGARTYFEASTYHPDDVIRVEDDHGR